MDSKEEKKVFSIRKRLASANHAARGIGIFFKSTHNAQAYLIFVIIVAYIGYVLNISVSEWISLIIVTSLVFITEAINTAIEIDIDLTSPEYHPFARDTKDVAAGAVLLSIIFAVIVGAIIFFPKIYTLFL